MKILTRVSLGILMLFMLESCVTQKAYDQLLARTNRLHEDSARYEHQLDICNDSNERLSSRLSNAELLYKKDKAVWETEKDVLLTQINQQGVELNEKDQALVDRAERLRELQSSLEAQIAATRALRKAVSDALISFSSDELQVSIEDGRVKVSLSENLLFPSAGVDLDPKGVDALGKLATVLKKSPDVNIMIVGFTDSLAIKTSRFRNNWDLSVIRATTIASILQEKYGVPGDRLTAAGQSEFDPVAGNRTEAGRALNRRTEIYLTPRLDALIDVLNQEEELTAPADEATN